MPEWIRCSDRLPMQQPEGWLTMDWVLVTGSREGSPITIARWNGKSWDFFYTNNISCEGPYAGDASSHLSYDEITHWMPLPSTKGLV
jgi:hypothetical protein